jgi:DNA modification methylase
MAASAVVPEILPPYRLIRADVIDALKTLPDNSVDSVVVDPPYELGFMGKAWDSTGIANSVPMWSEVLRVLKPGGHLLSFGGSRTYHRMASAVEDAGFEIRDQIMWVYGTGFPKSLDVSKSIDKAAGAVREIIRIAGKSGSARNCMAGDFAGGEYMETSATTEAAKQWDGWGTALKPAHEPIVVARKPLIGTVVANVLEHGTGAINIGASRIPGEPWKAHRATGLGSVKFFSEGITPVIDTVPDEGGRWPANLIHDGSSEVLAEFAKYGVSKSTQGKPRGSAVAGNGWGMTKTGAEYSDAGTPARFFYAAKANKKDRNEGCEELPGGNNHATVKPTELMRYLVKLITPPGGIVLDPLMGSGSTGKAAILEGFQFIGIDKEEAHVEIAEARLRHAYKEITK